MSGSEFETPTTEQERADRLNRELSGYDSVISDGKLSTRSASSEEERKKNEQEARAKFLIGLQNNYTDYSYPSDIPKYSVRIDGLKFSSRQVNEALETAHEETEQEIERLEDNIQDMRERGESPASIDLHAVQVLKQAEEKMEIEKAQEAVNDPEKLKEIVNKNEKIRELIKDKAPPPTEADKQIAATNASAASEMDKNGALNTESIQETFASAADPNQTNATPQEPTPTLKPAVIPTTSPEMIA